MHLVFRNVNETFYHMVWGFHDPGFGQHGGVSIPTDVTTSRYGEVMVVEEPVTVTFEKPTERVLFNLARDTNPFFHLYEALWMLAGRNDVAPLDYYNSRMPEFSDDGETLNGAYGYRWRYAPGKDERYGAGTVHTYHDQLVMLVEHLRANPHSRRAVLQMWNVQDDLLKVDTSKDVCCNLAATFQVEMGVCRHCGGRGWYGAASSVARIECECGGKPHGVPRYLNLTVFNRSNDLVWGMLGANAVHFSVLLEYLAARLGLEVGRYHQITANLHAYTKNWHPEEWLKSPYRDLYDDDRRRSQWQQMAERGEPELLRHPLNTVPLVQDPDRFDRELADIVRLNDGSRYYDYPPDETVYWHEPFLQTVARPLFAAFHAYKLRRYDWCLRWADLVAADDWRVAALGWLKRRMKGRLEEVVRT